jgi:hypothetical protein
VRAAGGGEAPRPLPHQRVRVGVPAHVIAHEPKPVPRRQHRVGDADLADGTRQALEVPQPLFRVQRRPGRGAVEIEQEHLRRRVGPAAQQQVLQVQISVVNSQVVHLADLQRRLADHAALLPRRRLRRILAQPATVVDQVLRLGHLDAQERQPPERAAHALAEHADRIGRPHAAALRGLRHHQFRQRAVHAPIQVAPDPREEPAVDVPPDHHRRQVFAERKGDDPGAPVRGKSALRHPRPGLVQRRQNVVRRLGPFLARHQHRIAFLDPPKTRRDEVFTFRDFGHRISIKVGGRQRRIISPRKAVANGGGILRASPHSRSGRHSPHSARSQESPAQPGISRAARNLPRRLSLARGGGRALKRYIVIRYTAMRYSVMQSSGRCRDGKRKCKRDGELIGPPLDARRGFRYSSIPERSIHARRTR